MIIIDILSWLAILGGVAFLFAGGIGLLRFPEFYTRCHAAGITDTGATFLILVGLMLQAGLSLITVKLLFILIFLFFTAPTATHALAHAAYTGGIKPKSVRDEAPLKDEAPTSERAD
jgi:multicomponent Na+:H+ antiporter subunit G